MRTVTELEALPTGELVELAHAALGVLAARPAPDNPAVSMDLAQRLGSALDLGEAALAGLVGRADRAGEPSAHRYAGSRGWLKTSLGMRTGRADERLTLARNLPRLPKVAALLEAGTLTYGYAATIADAVAHLSDRDCTRAEEILLGLVGEGLSVMKVARVGARIKEVIAQRDGRERPGEDAERDERSWWRLSRTLGGCGAVKGWFDPELTALVNDRLGPLTKPAGPEDDRDHAQRLADALRMMLSGGGTNWNATLVIKLTDPTDNAATNDAAVNHCDGGLRDGALNNAGVYGGGAARLDGGGAPCDGARSDTAFGDAAVNDAGVYGGGASRLDGAPCDGALNEGDGDVGAGVGGSARGVPVWPLQDARVSARLADGTPIRPELARLIALNAGVSTLLLGPDGIPLYLGRKARFVTRAQRQVLEALYETCASDECDIPARFCQLDHVDTWTKGGATDIDRLAPACSFHNRLRYAHPDWITHTRDGAGRWRYTIHRPGPTWTRPDQEEKGPDP